MFGWFKKKPRRVPTQLAVTSSQPARQTANVPRGDTQFPQAGGDVTNAPLASYNGGLEGNSKQIDGNTFEFTRETKVDVGCLAVRPPEHILKQFREAIAGTDATTVYLFSLSVAGEPSHLGVAVAPYDSDVMHRVGLSAQPIWSKFSPRNPTFDVVGLRGSLHDVIIKYGILVWGGRA